VGRWEVAAHQARQDFHKATTYLGDPEPAQGYTGTLESHTVTIYPQTGEAYLFSTVPQREWGPGHMWQMHSLEPTPDPLKQRL
jgi:hypothetical protein